MFLKALLVGSVLLVLFIAWTVFTKPTVDKYCPPCVEVSCPTCEQASCPAEKVCAPDKPLTESLTKALRDLRACEEGLEARDSRLDSDNTYEDSLKEQLSKCQNPQ